MGDVKKAISHHIFVFPFKWDYLKDSKSFYEGIGKRVDLDNFEELLCKGNWEEEELDINNNLKYNQYVYFYNNVRKAIYGEEYCKNKIKQHKSKVTRCFKHSLVNENSKYIITKTHTEKDEFGNKKNILKELSLKLSDIKLKIYETGVANLIFFVENYEYKSSEDILIINDYGRRIYPQFLPLSNCRESFLASKLSLEFCPGKRIDDDFDYNHFSSTMKISKIIMDILGIDFKYDKCDVEENEILLTPILDDRMFVMSLYRDNVKSNLIKSGMKWIREFLYKYTFLDNKDCTCQNDNMLTDLLKQSSYLRWKNYGTFYGVSRYSFVVIIDETSDSDFLVDHFKTIYYEMMLLVLTDRASILRLKDEASMLSMIPENDALKNIIELQKLYVTFSNNIYFKEVTAQEQGIELYDMVMDKMRIKEDVMSLNKNISGIYDYTNVINNNKVTKKVNFITYLGGVIGSISLVISIVALIVGLMDEYYHEFGSSTIHAIIGLLIFTILIVTLLIVRYIKKKES